jgi:hypothetical protein
MCDDIVAQADISMETLPQPVAWALLEQYAMGELMSDDLKNVCYLTVSTSLFMSTLTFILG